MGVTELILFFKSLPEIAKVLGEIVSTLKELRQESMQKELEVIRKDVDVQIQSLILAVNDEQRKKALLALSTALGK